MRKQLFVISLCFLASFVLSIPVNILNDDPNAEIQINGILAGKGSVSNYELQPGQHFIKVISDGSIIYAEPLKIDAYDNMKTVNTSHFVAAKTTSIANAGSTKIEAKRVREARGEFAAGIYYSKDITGVSFKYFPLGNIGMQIVGWEDNSPGDINQTFLARPMLQLGDYLMFGRHMNTYIALGYGTKKVINNSKSINAEIYQAVFGIEVTTALLGNPMSTVTKFVNDERAKNYHRHDDDDEGSAEGFLFFVAWSILGYMFDSMNNAFFDIEVGYEQIKHATGLPVSEMKLATGMHFYF